MRNPGFSGLAALLLSVPAWGSVPAHPGMLNYVEGQAKIAGQAVTNKSVGSAEVEQGQTIETGKGKAEILLTPGVFLRLGDNSALRMDNAGLANTSVELLRGSALVEATDLHKSNRIQVVDRQLTATVEKNGLYAFAADPASVSVYDGKLAVQDGDRTQDVKKGRRVTAASLKTEKFDADRDKQQGNDLYRWSDLRSEYLSEASASSARTYFGNAGGWNGGGWYWNQGFGYYSYLPGDGFLYSPFGWGFFAPGAFGYGGGFYRGGYYGGGYYGGGYRSGGYYRGGSGAVRSSAGVSRGSSFSRPAASGGFSGRSGGSFFGGAAGGAAGGARGGRR